MLFKQTGNQESAKLYLKISYTLPRCIAIATVRSNYLEVVAQRPLHQRHISAHAATPHTSLHPFILSQAYRTTGCARVGCMHISQAHPEQVVHIRPAYTPSATQAAPVLDLAFQFASSHPYPETLDPTTTQIVPSHNSALCLSLIHISEPTRPY